MFFYKSHRDMHVRGVHRLEFACAQCDYVATTSGHLKQHVDAVHLKLKPFECIELRCQKKFARRSDRNRHEFTVHWGERRFACVRCPARFGQSSNLRQHIDAVHLGLRPYECSICGHKFSQNGSRKHHVLAVHKQQRKHSCELCRSAFARRTALRAHFRTLKHAAALDEGDSVLTLEREDWFTMLDVLW